MQPAQPKSRPRQGGGFNQGLGQFSDEHLDERAFQNAVQQKSLGQQGTSSAQSSTGGSALGAHGQAGAGHSNPKTGMPPAPPREVGTFTEELIKRPAQDIIKGLKSLFDINSILGVDPVVDDPETQAHKKQMLNRWQGLNQEQQQVAQQLYKQKMEEKQRAEQEEQAKKQQQEKRKAQSVQMPSSPSKGPVGPGSKKPKAVQQLEQDRKSLGGPQSAG